MEQVNGLRIQAFVVTANGKMNAARLIDLVRINCSVRYQCPLAVYS